MAKTVLITGSSSGIGKACAVAFANAGWNVAATMRTPKGELSNIAHVKEFQLDVTNEESVAKAFQAVEQAFGAIDTVINNAGFAVEGVFEAMDEVVIQAQFDANVFGLMRVTRHAIKHLRIHGGGTIIQMSSMAGRLAFPAYSLYHASKWAVEGFTESLQYELNHFHIALKLIEPGVIKTDFYGKNHRYVRPTDDTSYDHFLDQVTRGTQHESMSGEKPEKVAQRVLRAAAKKSSKLRYPVGSPAPALLFLRKLLGERLLDRIVASRYRL